MKQPKKLTREQKFFVSNNLLNAEDWALVRDLGTYIEIINKSTNERREIKKLKRKLKAS